MKLTDFAIIFFVFAICIITRMSLKSDILQENMYGNTMYNNIMDNIAESALQRSVKGEKYAPSIDKEEVLQNIFHALSVSYMEMGDAYGVYLQDCIRLVIFTYPDGFWLAGAKEGREFIWSEKILFADGENTSQKEKVESILNECKKQYDVELLLPTEGNTSNTNTIDSYQLLLIYETYPVWIDGEKYGKVLFSGAKYNHKIGFT